jgi:hypothetical protein
MALYRQPCVFQVRHFACRTKYIAWSEPVRKILKTKYGKVKHTHKMNENQIILLRVHGKARSEAPGLKEEVRRVSRQKWAVPGFNPISGR